MKTYQVNHIGNDGKLYKVYRDLDLYQAHNIEQQLLEQGVARNDVYICTVHKMQKLKHTTSLQNFN